MMWLVDEKTKTAHLYSVHVVWSKGSIRTYTGSAGAFPRCLHLATTIDPATLELRAVEPTDYGTVDFCERCKTKSMCNCPAKFSCTTCINRGLERGT